jgi:putative ABC transport system permease protein
METLVQDVRYAFRMLLRSPGFALFAVAVLALGLAANTAIFSVADRVLLRPLPYHDADRLVMVWEDASSFGFPRDTPAPGNFADWKSRNQVFSEMAAMAFTPAFNMTGQGKPEVVDGRRVTANLFSVLGVQPSIGRNFVAGDDIPGAPHVAIVSHGFWTRRFGADTAVIGAEIWLDGEKFTVVGVMPRGFLFPSREEEIWVPVQFTQERLANHDSHFLQVVARLKPGVALKTANANLATIARDLEREHPDSNTKVGAYAVPLREQLAGDARPAILMLLGAVSFVLLIACANVANLLLARAAGRQRELALRLALGAGRMRIIRQMVTESLLLGGLAGAVGVALSIWATQFLSALVPAGISAARGSGVNARVLGFAFLLSILTVVLFGMIPAVRTSRVDLVSGLKQGGGRSGVGSGGRCLRDVLVVSEVALAIVLLAGATLMIRSFENLYHLDAGFTTDHVLAVRTPLSPKKYPDSATMNSFFDQVLARVGSLPGIVAAGYTTWVPLTNPGGATMVTLENHPPLPPGRQLIPNVREISKDYTRAVGMRLVEGRLLDARDGAGTQRVALVNQTMAAKYWPGEAVIGKRFTVGDSPNKPNWITVVGVVGDVHQAGLDVPARPEWYLPFSQFDDFPPEWLVVKTSVDPMSLAEPIRQQIWAVDNEQSVAGVMPLEDLVDDALAPRRMQASLLGGFAGLALLLATFGIYALLSFVVAQRTQEIGVRVALGAKPGNVLRMVISQGMKLFLIGAVLGVVAGLALARVLAHLLYGVSAADPVSFAGATVLLASVTLLACYIPARRAMRVDPMVALRYE